jgi:cell division protein FtsW (lipid II flippase)
VSFLQSRPNSRQDVIQIRLMKLAIYFHFIGCTALTLAPAVRFHSWSATLNWQQWLGFIVWLIGFLLWHRIVTRYLPDRDPYLIPIIALLTAWGLLTIYRLNYHFGYRQTVWLAVGITISIVIIRFKEILNFLRRYKYIWLMSGLFLTLLTFVIGVYPNGSGPALWLNFLGVFIQPSELLKILLVIFLAAYLADNLRIGFSLMQLLTPTLILIGMAFLILVAQHDLGTASLFIATYAVIVYLAIGKRRLLLYSFFAVLVALIIGYAVYNVIQIRIEAWLNPWLDANGRSFQIVQSLIAVANGGIFGRGIGLGSPGVVPVAHSDFIFPAIFEESGLVGAAGVVLLFAFFMVRAFSISLRSPNQFQRFLAAGLATAITVQAILIIGGSIRMLPLTGVTLPFISYGGSSLVTSFVSVSLLLTISNRSELHPAVLERGQPYRMISAIFLTLFAGLLLMSGWWSVFRSSSLLARNDNPRRFISDFYVPRGSIYDQNNQLLASTTGEVGNYSLTLPYPLLSSVIGYSNPNYGQAGLEASQDSLLRGITSDNFWQVFYTRLLFGQYPTGNDLRTSINLDLQQVADMQLGKNTGSILVLNANSGEILAIATSPTFDANFLSEKMESWKTDPEFPLLNRATQGSYPPGSITGGLILNYVSMNSKELPEVPSMIPSDDINDRFYCAKSDGDLSNWGNLVSDGCPFALKQLATTLDPVDFYNLYKNAGLLDQPEIQIEQAETLNLEDYNDINALFSGKSNLLVTPLQVAVAYAPFANGGKSVDPSLTTAYRIPGNGWELLVNKTVSEQATIKISPAISSLSFNNGFGWSVSATVPIDTGHLDWYVMGTPDNWQGVPITLVVALENSTPVKAREIGNAVFLYATNQ